MKLNHNQVEEALAGFESPLEIETASIEESNYVQEYNAKNRFTRAFDLCWKARGYVGNFEKDHEQFFEAFKKSDLYPHAEVADIVSFLENEFYMKYEFPLYQDFEDLRY